MITGAIEADETLTVKRKKKLSAANLQWIMTAPKQNCE
jgi:hypothetical protein